MHSAICLPFANTTVRCNTPQNEKAEKLPCWWAHLCSLVVLLEAQKVSKAHKPMYEIPYFVGNEAQTKLSSYSAKHINMW